MAKRKPTINSYEKAIQELQEIVDNLQEETIGIDDLSGKVKRAAELIQFCKEKLRSTDSDIKNIFNE